ncbi:MAG TPA: UDP-N-acetylmuramate dehydrogenase [Candidatus Dormibacteraeota bacterium]|nr:UDP-N-acetylmuramate dehydrogenase [Candidatus Dormibacteraeota bacterium]
MSWRAEPNLAWLRSLPGVRENHPLAKHTSLNIGGPADFFLEAADVGAVVREARRREVPVRVIGAGTNLLVSDAGVEGLVVRDVDRRFRRDGERLFAGAGLKMMRLARLAADQDLVGLEFAIGIPGTVGGAVYQDAGCWGREVREVLVEVEGDGRRWRPEVLGLGYRTSAFRHGEMEGELISGAWFQLRPGDGAAARRQMAQWTAERLRTQPIKSKNCGSVFKNPPGDSAGRLVEAAGLKGEREGGAVISPKHANFIENLGAATAVDVRALIERAQGAVAERFEITLETEVEMIGR